MNKPQSDPPRARLQALLAIPERQRTEAEWDELNELEIMMAAANRDVIPKQGVARNVPAHGGQPKPHNNPQGRKPGRKFHKRPPKRQDP